jgi:hypothetical protein
MSQNAATKPLRDISRNGKGSHGALPEIAQQQTWLSRYFAPRQEVEIVAEQSSRGLFIPYPLLGVIVTLAIVVISGIVALEVQVSNLSTTLLLRDADQRAEITAIKEKAAQLEVYIHNDREKLIDIQSTLREAEKTKRRN